MLLALPRAVLWKQARSPLAWLFVGASAVAVPLMAHWSPTRDLDPGGLADGLVAAWCPLAGLLGACAALASLQGMEPFRDWLTRRSRVRMELLALGLIAFLAQVPIVLGGLLASQAPTTTATLLAPLLISAHLAALSSLILQARLPWAPVFLVGATWLPALLPDRVGNHLRFLLDPTQHFSALSAFGSAPAGAAACLSTVVALLLGAAFLRRPPRT